MGVLINNSTGLPLLLTLELPDRGNIEKESCIPEGFYQGISYSSKKFKKAFLITNVPNRDNILIHAGNTTKDTTGCILVGLQYGTLHNKPAVLNSRKALTLLEEIVFNKNSFDLVVEY